MHDQTKSFVHLFKGGGVEGRRSAPRAAAKRFERNPPKAGS